ncbi:MAG TPA: hypothetical protein VGL03_13540 [Thermoanaerobaculia bacterium]|jgi:hypothetical protein
MGVISPKRLREVAAALWLVGAALLEGSAAPQEPERKRGEKKPAVDAIASPLEQRLRGKADPKDVVIDVRWPYKEDAFTDCRVYGNGVGIWRRQAQFRLSKPEVLALLKTVKEARFGLLPNLFGEGEGIEKEVKGAFTVSFESVEKRVVQLDEGHQSRDLERLAAGFLTSCETAAAKEAVRVSSFDDAFGKLAGGTLAPEALEILFHRKTLHAGEGPSEDWSLRINGRRAKDRDVAAGQAPGSSRELALTDKEFGELLRVLREGDLANQRRNLYASQYTDLRVRVLNKARGIQARRFAGMTSQTNGERQQAFDRVAAELVALHRRVRAEGEPVNPPPVTSSDEARAEREKEKD